VDDDVEEGEDEGDPQRHEQGDGPPQPAPVEPDEEQLGHDRPV
ncbi:MAG: hypothetical protein AVDCRST_MAG17-383, partial [uncultured Solirubrobacterales bacterium]